jgi:hypothetical protein
MDAGKQQLRTNLPGFFSGEGGGPRRTVCEVLRFLRAGVAILLGIGVGIVRGEMPDISSVPPDLVVPPLAEGAPGPGKRVRVGDPAGVYHVLYLPQDWDPARRWPVLVEYAGNGGYRNRFGDESRGRPEDSCLGYGLSGGKGFLWLCLPYLSADASRNVATWWGDPPDYTVRPTVDYCVKTVDAVCAQYGGDSERVVLSGFSRGAIATFFIGLQDDRIASRWRGFFAYSHFDGPRRWPYPGSDEASAAQRFSRARGRPLFVCGEEANAEQTQRWMEDRYGPGALRGITFRSTGYRNHHDAWILRPGEAREEARRWLRETLQ